MAHPVPISTKDFLYPNPNVDPAYNIIVLKPTLMHTSPYPTQHCLNFSVTTGSNLHDAFTCVYIHNVLQFCVDRGVKPSDMPLQIPGMYTSWSTLVLTSYPYKERVWWHKPKFLSLLKYWRLATVGVSRVVTHVCAVLRAVTGAYIHHIWDYNPQSLL